MKSYLRCLFSIPFLIIVLFKCDSIAVEADSIRKLDLESKVIPLKTTKAENGFEDLDKLQEILKDKKIVSMGEATHGTKEFFQMKHRMFEFLVEKMGYRLFAIEADFGAAKNVNDYILNGVGNANDAVKSMKFWTWSTEEVVDMVEWMRNYNKNPEHKSKIQFYGFDMQCASENGTRVLDYIKKVDNNDLSEFQKKLLDVNNTRIDLYSEDMLNNIKNNIEELKDIFEKNKQNYIKKSSISEYELAYQDLNVITQFIEYTAIKKNTNLTNITNMTNMTNMRDYYMSQNIKWILDYERQFGNDKIMLWAHNGHVSKKFPNYTSMGENLKKVFNDKLYVIGFDFYEGNFRAMPCDDKGKILSQRLAKFNVDKSDSNSFAYSFEKTGIPLIFMDFKSASEDKNIAAWLSQKQLIHSIGATYNGKVDQCMAPEIPVESYDGLIFVKKTSAAIGIKGYETGVENGDTMIAVYRNMYKIAIVSILIIILIVGVSRYKNKKMKSNV